jgi:hypothetical protein
MAARLIELPAPRGPLSETLFEALRGAPGGLEAPGPVEAADPIADEDLQLALYVAYELAYSGIRGVDEAWEWEPSLIAFRNALERPFEAAVAELVRPATGEELRSVGGALQRIVAEDPGPPRARRPPLGLPVEGG